MLLFVGDGGNCLRPVIVTGVDFRFRGEAGQSMQAAVQGAWIAARQVGPADECHEQGVAREQCVACIKGDGAR